MQVLIIMRHNNQSHKLVWKYQNICSVGTNPHMPTHKHHHHCREFDRVVAQRKCVRLLTGRLAVQTQVQSIGLRSFIFLVFRRFL